MLVNRDSLERPLGAIPGLKRIQRHHRVQVILTPQEIQAIFGQIPGTPKLIMPALRASQLSSADLSMIFPISNPINAPQS